MAYVGRYQGRPRDDYREYTFAGGVFRYEGSWMDGKMHGRGVFSMQDGAVYEGNFTGGEIDGIGLKRWPDGSTYSGSFREGEMHGDGVFLSASGERYEGQWADNQRSGTGELLFVTKNIYRGQFSAHMPHGIGRLEYAGTGCIYEGEWKQGKKHGQGILHGPTGLCLYKGFWETDQRHGPGVGIIEATNSTSSTSISYHGQWTNDHPEVATVRLGAKLLAQDNQTLEEMPAILTVRNKQIPPVAIACCSSSDGDQAIVCGENGRCVALTVHEGQAPANNSPDPNSDGLPSSAQWQFVLPGAMKEPESEMKSVTERTADGESIADTDVPVTEEGTNDADTAHPLSEETRVNKVEAPCSDGVAMFRDLALPSATPIGNYFLVCQSMATDSVPPVYIQLAVVDDEQPSTSQPPARK